MSRNDQHRSWPVRRAHRQGASQAELLERLRVHERDGTLPTNARFLFYELVQPGVVSKDATGARRADQELHDALTHLREAGWCRGMRSKTRPARCDSWRPRRASPSTWSTRCITPSLDRWGGKPAPLILCESRSLAGVLRDLAGRYACPIASTNGQCRGFLVDEGRADAAGRSAGAVPRRLGSVRSPDRGGHQAHPGRAQRVVGRTGTPPRPEASRRTAVATGPLGAGRADHRAGRRATSCPGDQQAGPPLRTASAGGTSTRSRPRRSARPTSWPRCAPGSTS